jgi:hypothetical protein
VALVARPVATEVEEPTSVGVSELGRRVRWCRGDEVSGWWRDERGDPDAEEDGPAAGRPDPLGNPAAPWSGPFHAELVAVGIGQHDVPLLRALPDVEVAGAEPSAVATVCCWSARLALVR